MVITLDENQKRIKDLAEGAILQDKITRVNVIEELKQRIRQLSPDKAIEVVRAIETAPGLNFLIPAGIFGDARAVLFARLQGMQKTSG